MIFKRMRQSLTTYSSEKARYVCGTGDQMQTLKVQLSNMIVPPSNYVLSDINFNPASTIQQPTK